MQQRESMTQNHSEIVVIGGGHNGLGAATYLARAGRQVRVFEARAELGGGVASGDGVLLCMRCGQTGLVEATYLARAGRQVRVFEARAELGGAVASADVFTGV